MFGKKTSIRVYSITVVVFAHCLSVLFAEISYIRFGLFRLMSFFKKLETRPIHNYNCLSFDAFHFFYLFYFLQKPNYYQTEANIAIIPTAEV